MKILSLLTLVVLSSSCATQTVISENQLQEEQNEVKAEIPEHNVQVHIRQHIPYCGGAYPSDDQLNMSSLYGSTLVLINLKDGSKTDINSITGVFYLNLEPGNYAVKEKYKDVPFKEFYASVDPIGGNYIVQIDDDNNCYKRWWASNLLEFEVTTSKPVQIFNGSVSSSCFTGINPCISYNGPYPP